MDHFHARRFENIQALRGIAALFVVLEHVRYLSCGAFGVDIFFCISGFMAMFTTHRTREKFLRKRLIRILPFYWLMTFFTYGLVLLMPDMFANTRAEFSFLWKSLCFVPFEITEGVFQTLMRVGWTVNYEMFFYLLFAISCRISLKYRGLICSGFLCVLVGLAHLLPANFVPLTFYGEFIQLEFVLGILCYYTAKALYCRAESRPLPFQVSLLCVPASILIFCALPLIQRSGRVTTANRLIWFGIPAALLLLLVLLAELKLTAPKLLTRLGDISFSVYLIHYYPIMLIDRRVYSLEHYSLTAVIVTVLGILLILALSYIAWYLIENKLTGIFRKLM